MRDALQISEHPQMVESRRDGHVCLHRWELTIAGSPAVPRAFGIVGAPWLHSFVRLHSRLRGWGPDPALLRGQVQVYRWQGAAIEKVLCCEHADRRIESVCARFEHCGILADVNE